MTLFTDNEGFPQVGDLYKNTRNNRLAQVLAINEEGQELIMGSLGRFHKVDGEWEHDLPPRPVVIRATMLPGKPLALRETPAGAEIYRKVTVNAVLKEVYIPVPS